MLQRDALGLIHADIAGGGGLSGGARLNASFADGAGDRVDFVLILGGSGDKFDFVHQHAVLAVELGLGERHVGGGERSVAQRDGARLFAGDSLSAGHGFGARGLLAGAHVLVFGEVFYARAAHSAGNRVHVIVVFGRRGVKLDFVEPQHIVGVQADFQQRDVRFSQPRVGERLVQRLLLADHDGGRVLIGGHFQRLLARQRPGPLDDRAVGRADPVFVFKAVAPEFDVIGRLAVLGFNLGGEEQRALAGRAGGFQSQIFSGGLVEGALREGRSVQQERQYERQSQQGFQRGFECRFH